VQVDANLGLSFPTPPQTIDGGIFGVEIPTSAKISKSGGPAGPNHSRYAVVYAVQDYARPTAGSDVRAAILNRNAVPIAGPIGVAATSAFESLPDVDGDGDNWVAAWSSQPFAGSSIVHDRPVLQSHQQRSLPESSRAA